MYNEYQIEHHECDECMSKGLCSVNPALNSIQEVILLYLKELSFYLVKLKDFGVTNDSIKIKILGVLLNIVSNAEYNQKQFYEMVSGLHDDIEQSKALYESFCQKHQMDIETVKTYFKRSKKFELTDAIRKGEKYFLKKAHSFTAVQKDIFDIMLFLAKSVGLKMSEAKNLGISYEDAYYATLSMLDAMNFSNFSQERALEEIRKYILAYYEIIRDVFYAQIDKYGAIRQRDVCFSTEIGKAILVSGSDYTMLELVLEAVEKTDIAVYTHGLEFLMAQSHEKLYNNPHLKGHFGKSLDSSLIDFAAFPGSILMTKSSLQSIEYLYRGRLYTFDSVPSQGVVRLQRDNLAPLIKSAFDAKGFSKETVKPSLKVGFNLDEVNQKIDTLIQEIKDNKIKNIYFAGVLNYQNTHSSYFEKFHSLMKDDDFMISLSYKKTANNILCFDTFNDYSLFYLILKRLKEQLDLKTVNITVFLTKCDKHTISCLLYLREIGIRHIYMCKCPSSLINPALVYTLQELYDIKEFLDPHKDFEEINSQ